jgi:DNA invertase Pin-like site-specific DNA recombinase
MDVVIYARLSQRGEEVDLERQVKLCRERATTEGWTVVAEHVDNGVSGWKRGVTRREYERMLAALDGSAEVLAYNADRLFRQDRERLRFFEMYREELRLRYVHFVDGQDADLGNADGRKYFRDLGSAAEHQSDRASERIQRKMEELAQDGRRWGGQRPFGYTRDMELLPAEANAIRQGAEAVLEGRSAYHVARTWNEAGITATGGSRWSERAVTRVLSSALIAGLREHKRDGQVLGVYPARWSAIVTPDEHEVLRSLLATKKPRPTMPRRHPLSGILHCWSCGGGMRGTTIADGKRIYACMLPTGCGKTTIVANPTEDFVLDAVQQRDPEYREKHRLDVAPEPGLTRESLLALGRIEEKRRALQVAADLGVDISGAIATLNEEERVIRESVTPRADLPPDPEKDDPKRRERRHGGELTEAEVLQTRDWVAAFVERVVVNASRNPRAPVSDRLAIEWRN